MCHPGTCRYVITYCVYLTQQSVSGDGQGEMIGALFGEVPVKGGEGVGGRGGGEAGWREKAGRKLKE